MDEPVKPTTSVRPVRASTSRTSGGAASKNLRAARPVAIISSAARERTPSGSPSPHTRSGRMARWRSSMRSHTAWPTRWLLMAKLSTPADCSSSHLAAT